MAEPAAPRGWTAAPDGGNNGKCWSCRVIASSLMDRIGRVLTSGGEKDVEKLTGARDQADNRDPRPKGVDFGAFRNRPATRPLCCWPGVGATPQPSIVSCRSFTTNSAALPVAICGTSPPATPCRPPPW